LPITITDIQPALSIQPWRRGRIIWIAHLKRQQSKSTRHRGRKTCLHHKTVAAVAWFFKLVPDVFTIAFNATLYKRLFEKALKISTNNALQSSTACNWGIINWLFPMAIKISSTPSNKQVRSFSLREALEYLSLERRNLLRTSDFGNDDTHRVVLRVLVINKPIAYDEAYTFIISLRAVQTYSGRLQRPNNHIFHTSCRDCLPFARRTALGCQAASFIAGFR